MRRLRFQMEKNIEHHVHMFEKETGCTVSGVELVRRYQIGVPNTLDHVHVEVKL